MFVPQQNVLNRFKW